MLTAHDRQNWEEFFRNFRYKPNWHFELEYVVDWNVLYLEIVMRVPDSRDTSDRPPTIRVNRKLSLDFFPNEEYANGYVRSIIRNMEDHEIDEWFRYKGELVFDPHKEN